MKKLSIYLVIAFLLSSLSCPSTTTMVLSYQPKTSNFKLSLSLKGKAGTPIGPIEVDEKLESTLVKTNESAADPFTYTLSLQNAQIQSNFEMVSSFASSLKDYPLSISHKKDGSVVIDSTKLDTSILALFYYLLFPLLPVEEVQGGETWADKKEVAFDTEQGAISIIKTQNFTLDSLKQGSKEAFLSSTFILEPYQNGKLIGTGKGTSNVVFKNDIGEVDEVVTNGTLELSDFTYTASMGFLSIPTQVTGAFEFSISLFRQKE